MSIALITSINNCTTQKLNYLARYCLLVVLFYDFEIIEIFNPIKNGFLIKFFRKIFFISILFRYIIQDLSWNYKKTLLGVLKWKSVVRGKISSFDIWSKTSAFIHETIQISVGREKETRSVRSAIISGMTSRAEEITPPGRVRDAQIFESGGASSGRSAVSTPC